MRVARVARPSARKPSAPVREDTTESPAAARRVARPVQKASAEAMPRPSKKATQAPPAPAQETSRVQEDIDAAQAATDSARITQRYMERIKNPMTAIRARCVQCCNGQPSEVRLCPTVGCALHPFRMGDNPYNKKTRRGLAAAAGMTLEEYDKMHGFTEGDEE